MGANFLNWKRLPSGPVWLVSPHLMAWQKKALDQAKRQVPDCPQTIWVLSSGTQSVNQVKCVALRREAFLCSAEAVNSHLQSSAKDHWLLAIPDYHVGGFSIHARAHLSGAQVTRLTKWSPANFSEVVQQKRITLTSLVPTQIHDLVAAKVRCGPSLRAIVVGGGALSQSLYTSARALGWPILPSYGLTETASQVATAALSSLSSPDLPRLEVLQHAQIELREGRVCIRGGSLSHWVAKVNADGQFTLEDPRRQGWLLTEDMGAWHGSQLELLGRRDQVVKVLGVLVPIPQIESDLQQTFRSAGVEGRLVVLPLPSEREGHELILISDANVSFAQFETLVRSYNERTVRPQRVSRWGWMEALKEGELHKIKRAELLSRLRLV